MPGWAARIPLPRGRQAWVVALLLVALAFGGGGSGAGLANLVVQLAGIAVLALHPRAVFAFFAQAPRAIAALVAASILLPLLQLVPLPPALWQGLPGRDLVTASYDLIGAQGVWHPLSLSVSRTAIACSSLLAPLAILALAWDLPQERQRGLLLAIAAGGVAMVVLGAQQLATGNRFPVFYDEVYGSADLQGTFANRNSGALMLDIALAALVAAVPWRRGSAAWKLGTVAIAALLAIGVVLTGSRSGMMLLGVPALLAAWVWWSGQRAARDRRKVLGILLVLVLAGAAAGILLSGTQRVRQSLSRFHSVEDEQRPAIWKDTLEATRRYWPVGSGIGSFDAVFQVDEALENLSYGRAGRAHNDFLEAALESGIAGVLLLAGWAVALAVLGWRALRCGGPGVPADAAAAAIALIALQSVTDYPLRSQTLLCVAALMLALLIGAGGQGERARRGGPPRG